MTEPLAPAKGAAGVAPNGKIYVRESTGRHANWRWGCVWLTQLVYFGVPWLTWNGRQLLLFDLAGQKLYVFGLVLWPQDFIYLAALLIILAGVLFLSSAVVGRIWCGFACPHTVYTDLFMWIERRIEGGRSARIRLDCGPWSFRKWRKKSLKHGAWLLLSASIGFVFVGYFTPIRGLWQQLPSFALAPWHVFWIGAYGVLAYVNAGTMREQICRTLCPHARFQSIMFGHDTMLVAYDAKRGEPRGLRNRKSLAQDKVQGACIDCTLCIQVCPTGSDIRQGLHYDCIGCAACTDVCNAVMDKIGAPRGLIGYASAHGAGLRLVQRPGLLIGAAALVSMSAALAVALTLRVPLELDVMRERSALHGAGQEGAVGNVYRLHVANTDELAHRYLISVSGIATIALATPAAVALDANAGRVVPVRVRIDPGQGKAGSNPILFILQDRDHPAVRVTQKAVFLVSRD